MALSRVVSDTQYRKMSWP